MGKKHADRSNDTGSMELEPFSTLDTGFCIEINSWTGREREEDRRNEVERKR